MAIHHTELEAQMYSGIMENRPGLVGLERFREAFDASPNKNPVLDAYENTALHLAARYGRLEICHLILEEICGAELAAVTNDLGWHPLHSALY